MRRTGTRVPLSSLKTVTFKSNEYTAARRSSPIPQLTCVGKACKTFQPDVVQCYNMGGSEDDVQWRCEAELPEGIRMGGVTVSCEGWDRPGDEYVLKGSCGLEYRLVQLPGTSDASTSSSGWAWDDVQSYLFWAFFLSIATFLVYRFYRALFPSAPTAFGTTQPRPPPNAPRNGPGSNWFSSGGGGNWGSWGNNNDAPPPYSGPKPSPSTDGSWRPGFWTGLGLGGAAAQMYNNYNRPQYADPYSYGYAPRYDWERERFGAYAPRPVRQEDRGPASAGPSRPRQTGGGETRTSTGYGGSRVR